MTKVSVLIPSFGEKERLFKLIKKLKKCKEIREIIVVSPDKFVKKLKSKMVKVIIERKRKGKSAAINKGLKLINSEIILLLTSDIILEGSVSYLLKWFKKENIGAVVGKILADKNGKKYWLSKVIWNLHSLVCEIEPKGTEIMAFKKIFNKIDETLDDEVFIEYMIRKKGYKIVYEPKCFGYTKSPNTLLYFFRQRERSFLSHLEIIKKYSFYPSTLNTTILLKVIKKFFYTSNFKDIIVFFLVCLIEIIARVSAIVKFIFSKYKYAWERENF
ncbi:MAG: glycosyltransferase [Candidatus Aenigmatarchaeota archaeon]